MANQTTFFSLSLDTLFMLYVFFMCDYVLKFQISSWE